MEQSWSGDARTRWTKSTWLWLIGILVIGSILRAAILWVTEPIIWPDSGGYLYQAQGLMDGDLSRDVGTRTPTYPLFILLAGNDTHRIVLFQSLIGLVNTALIFWITWTITQTNLVAAMASLAYALDVNQIQYEISILTETITAFLLLASVALLILAWKNMDKKSIQVGYFGPLDSSVG
jgi:hypothetical protein